MPLDRRRFLAGSGALTAAGLASGLADPASATAAGRLNHDGPLQVNPLGGPAARMHRVPFHGRHQAGILTPPPPAACFIALDVTAAHRKDLASLFKELTHRARFLTAGGTPPNLGTSAPPSDSGTLGPHVPADGLTLTVGVGSSLFDDRFGLKHHKPRHLSPMHPFPNDDLDPAQTGGDLILQVCAGSPDVVLHALRDIARHTRGGMQIRWRIDGFISPPRPGGVPRNHQGFNDGIANPDVQRPHIADQLLWVTKHHHEPAWATGGSYHVCRIIKMFIEFWDRVSLTEQEGMIGRQRASGAPLGGYHQSDIPDYRADPLGKKIPLDAHIRLANPRTKHSEHSRIFRRGYNYDRGVDANGNLDLGLVFNCFQSNLAAQFIASQTRLNGEPLVDYISPVGGGYFFSLPGVRDHGDWYGRSLLDAR
jgi:deferrochelatase/peroxidase EfeB